MSHTCNYLTDVGKLGVVISALYSLAVTYSVTPFIQNLHWNRDVAASICQNHLPKVLNTDPKKITPKPTNISQTWAVVDMGFLRGRTVPRAPIYYLTDFSRKLLFRCHSGFWNQRISKTACILSMANQSLFFFLYYNHLQYLCSMT